MGAWWHPKAVLAADFYNGRYGLFARESVLASLEGTVRASSHYLADASGNFQSFANDNIARVDGVGAYVGGQVTPYVKDNTDASTGLWGNVYGLTRTKLTGKRLGIFSRVSIQSKGAIYHRIGTNSFTPSIVPHFVTLYWEPGTSGRAYWEFDTSAGIYIIQGQPGAMVGSVFSGAPGTFSAINDVLTSDGVTRKLSCIWTPPIATSYLITIGPGSSVTGQDIIVCGLDLQPIRYETPFIVSSGASVSMRSASNVSAPASGGAPFAGFTESGLASALSARVKFQLTHVGDGVTRPLIGISDGTVNNRLRFFIDTDDKPAVAVISGGVTLATAKLATALTAGTYVLAANFDPANGLYLVRGDTGEQASAALSAMPSGLSLMRYGSSVGENYLNDYLHEVQVAQVMTQADAKNWAQNILTASLSVTCNGDTLDATAEARIDAQVEAIMADALLAATAEAGIDANLDVTCADDVFVSANDYVPTYPSPPVVSTKPRSRGKHIAAQPRASHTPARPRGAHTPARPRNSR